jgi:hypothetical protein
LNISDKDLADLAYLGLTPHLKEILEIHVFADVSQVLYRALNCESRAKESISFPKSSEQPRNKRHVNVVEYSSESSDDKKEDMCVAKWSWGSKSKPFICSSLKSASKSRQDEMRYTFDVAKSDSIFDYLLQARQIKLSSGHIMPSPEQLKKHAYFKWHNFYSHATNNCNIFRRQIQSAINKGRLKFVESPQIKLDNDTFPVYMNMVELDGKKVLIQPS